MPEIPLSTFADFVSKASTAKLHVISDYEEGYDYKTDFYKPIRERIIEMHKNGEPDSVLRELAKGLSDKKKRENYPAIVKGYRAWLKNHEVTWQKPLSSQWSHKELIVKVNPELGLVIDGTPHLVKLYFRQDKLSKAACSIITQMMQGSLSKARDKGIRIALLDVRRSKLHTSGAYDSQLETMLQLEADYWLGLWTGIQKKSAK